MCKMPRKKKQFLHLEDRFHQDLLAGKAMTFTLSVISEGSAYLQMSRIFAKCGIVPPTKHEFETCLRAIGKSAQKLAEQSMEKWRKSIPPGDSLSYDGAWATKRNSSHCIVEMISKALHKIVDRRLIHRKMGNKKTEKVYDVTSNYMENIGIKEMRDLWMSDTRISAVIKDGDIETHKNFEGLLYDDELIECLDPGHSKSPLLTIFDSCNEDKAMNGWKELIIKYFPKVCRADQDDEHKKAMWLSTYETFLNEQKGKIDTCKNKKLFNDQAKNCVQNFLHESLTLVQKCFHGDTQSNESFHSLKARMAPKNTAWGFSWDIRMNMCVLKWNEENWYELLEDDLHLPSIKDSCKKILDSYDEERKKAKAHSSTPDYKRHRATVRAERRYNNKMHKEGHFYASSSQPSPTIQKRTKYKLPEQKTFPGVQSDINTSFIGASLQILNRTNLSSSLSSESEHCPLLLNIMNSLNSLSSGGFVGKHTVSAILNSYNAKSCSANPVDFISMILSKIDASTILTQRITETSANCPVCHYNQNDQTSSFYIELPKLTNDIQNDINNAFGTIKHTVECRNCQSLCNISERFSITDSDLPLLLVTQNITQTENENFPNSLIINGIHYCIDSIVYQEEGKYIVRARSNEYNRLIIFNDARCCLSIKHLNFPIRNAIMIMCKPMHTENVQGLKNYGNTCYLNAALQILFNILPFRKCLFQITTGNKTINMLQRLFYKMTIKTKTCHPKLLLHNLPIQANQQNDTMEIMNFFIDHIIDTNSTTDTGQVMRNIFDINIDRFQKVKEKTTIVSDVSHYTEVCPNDGDLLRSLHKIEFHETVSNSKNTANIETWHVVQHLPIVTLFQINRYKYNKDKSQCQKDFSAYSFPEEFLSSAITSNPDIKQTKYVLNGVIVHSGSIQRGHYYAYIKNVDGQWMKINDSKVTLSNKQEAIDDNFGGEKKKYSAFVLSYIRENEIAAPLDIKFENKEYYENDIYNDSLFTDEKWTTKEIEALIKYLRNYGRDRGKSSSDTRESHEVKKAINVLDNEEYFNAVVRDFKIPISYHDYTEDTRYADIMYDIACSHDFNCVEPSPTMIKPAPYWNTGYDQSALVHANEDGLLNAKFIYHGKPFDMVAYLKQLIDNYTVLSKQKFIFRGKEFQEMVIDILHYGFPSLERFQKYSSFRDYPPELIGKWVKVVLHAINTGGKTPYPISQYLKSTSKLHLDYFKKIRTNQANLSGFYAEEIERMQILDIFGVQPKYQPKTSCILHLKEYSELRQLNNLEPRPLNDEMLKVPISIGSKDTPFFLTRRIICENIGELVPNQNFYCPNVIYLLGWTVKIAVSDYIDQKKQIIIEESIEILNEEPSFVLKSPDRKDFCIREKSPQSAWDAYTELCLRNDTPYCPYSGDDMFGFICSNYHRIVSSLLSKCHAESYSYQVRYFEQRNFIQIDNKCKCNDNSLLSVNDRMPVTEISNDPTFKYFTSAGTKDEKQKCANDSSKSLPKDRGHSLLNDRVHSLINDSHAKEIDDMINDWQPNHQ